MTISEHPDLLLDWDREENIKIGQDPEQITVCSRERVFWKCHVCGGKWNTSVKERRGCPYCTGFKALPGFNDLATTHPQLALEWDHEKNGSLLPQQFTRGSSKKVYWRCEKGHSWFAIIHSRAAGRGCPYCHNRRVLPGFNDLATIAPDLAKEWHPEKNAPLSPFDVLAGSKRNAWWQCANGHEWEARICYRRRDKGCPVCKRTGFITGVNDFATVHPDLIADWDYEKNPGSPAEYGCYSRERVWWRCKRGHSWRAAISDRSKGTGCPKCSEETRVSFPEKALFFYIRKHFPDAQTNYRAPWLGPYELDIYLPEYQFAVEYDGVYGHSTERGLARDMRKNDVCAKNNVVLFRVREPGCGEVGAGSIDYIMPGQNALPEALLFLFNEIETRIGHSSGFSLQEVNIDRDAGSIYSLIEYTEKINSLLVREPEAAMLWHPTKNGRLTPKMVQPGSSKIVWWLGPCGHEWRSAISYEVASKKCPYCTGKRVLQGFNDLSTTNPALASEWDSEKNAPLTASMITAGSGKKVWWQCARGHSWQASVVSRNRGNGCPICANRLVLRGYNDIASFPQLLADWDYEKNVGVRPEDVCIGSYRKYWWRCDRCGHEWSASADDRYRGSGCPSCALRTGRRHARQTFVRKRGSFADAHPELMDEWLWEKNVDVDPGSITHSYGKKVWWRCRTCSHEWESTVAARSAGTGCPKCGEQRRVASRRAALLKKKPPITVTHPEIAREWCYEKNGDLLPGQITAGSGKRVWWRCAVCGNQWASVVYDRTRGKGNCNQCREKVQ